MKILVFAIRNLSNKYQVSKKDFINVVIHIKNGYFDIWRISHVVRINLQFKIIGVLKTKSELQKSTTLNLGTGRSRTSSLDHNFGICDLGSRIWTTG